MTQSDDNADGEQLKEGTSGDAEKKELETALPMMLPPDMRSVDGSAKPASEKSSNKTPLETLKSSSGSTRRANFDKLAIPGFKIERELGRGGMGAVFLATDETLDRKVALKIVSQSMVGSSSLRDRFDSEVKTLASLHHSNIAQLYSAGLSNDEPYFAMEFVDGSTLDLFAPEPLKDKNAAELMIQLCDAVEYCHQQGVIHRDLKPSNILMTQKGQPKIADFGLAKALHTDDTSTKTGEILGTPGYMSPEQAGGVVKKIGPSCDVYGLGAILYRLLTGRAPFVSQEPFQTVIQVLSEEPIAPRNLNRSVSRDLETICLKCLEKKTNKRFESVKALQDDLKRFVEDKPILARPNSWIQVSGKWIRRNPTTTVGVVALVFVIIGSIVGLIMHNSVLSNELDRSKRLANTGSEFALWAVQDHLNALVKVSGTTSVREEFVDRVKEYLEASYQDMPSDPIYTERLGFTYVQLGATQGAGGQDTSRDLKKARSNLERALELYDRAERVAPSDRLSRLKAEALLSMCDLEASQGNFAEKEKLFAEAESLMNSARDGSSESLRLEIYFLNAKAGTQLSLAKYEDARSTLGKMSELIDQLSKFDDKSSVESAAHQRIIVRYLLAQCSRQQNDLKAAESEIREAVSLAEKAYLSDPTDLTKRTRLASMLQRLGDVLMEIFKSDKALEVYKRSTDLARQRVKENPKSIDAQISLQSHLSRLASTYQYLNDLDQAAVIMFENIDSQQALIKLGKDEIMVEQNLIIQINSWAGLAVQQSDYKEAKRRFEVHRQHCEDYIEKYDDDTFAINQLAESQLSQGLMVFLIFTSTESEPTTVRKQPEYQLIKDHCNKSLSYFRDYEKWKPLDVNQNNNKKSLENILKLLDEYVEKIEATGDL